MMRNTILATTKEEYDLLDAKLAEGWILDPAITNGKPYLLDNATVWPLVFYESEEEKPVDEKKPGEFDDVEDLKDVPNAEVSGLLKQGYRIQSIFAKNTILLKRKENIPINVEEVNI